MAKRLGRPRNARTVRGWLVAAAGFVFALAGAVPPARAADDDPYARPEAWLCRPGVSDLCAAPVVATVVQSDGSRGIRVFKPNPAAPIDCFYVYPTVSEDPAGNSGMTSGPGERRAVAQQFAAFASVCRPFAPIYRQVTIAGVEATLRREPLPVDFKLPYEDVRAAWRRYLVHDNDGRGVVLIGHSQGARILARLLVHEIEGKPEQRLLAGALMLGFDVEVPEGRDVGGTFKAIPLCRAAGQMGCVVAYETFPAASPPPDDSRFARPETPGMEIACTDPAALAGGKLDPILATQTNLIGKPPLDPGWAAFARRLDAPFVSLPGIASGHCVEGPEASYSVSINPPASPGAWPATLPGALVVEGRLLKSWGWHLIDVNVAMGNLIAFVSTLRKPGP
ncbi:MAG TPA: DUF3089 domain-containing protein [Roseiarcus sp.]|nr:DUF3089 domain-containing protein [Roseiarcus sp.]